MFYPDLTPFEYSSTYTGLNVGWLEKGNKFPKEEPSAEFLDALHDVIASGSFKKSICAGLHFCTLCRFRKNFAQRNGNEISMGNSEIAIPYRRKTYIAPSLVYHYVSSHRYLPPEPFILGVLKAAKTIKKQKSKPDSQKHSKSKRNRHEWLFDESKALYKRGRKEKFESLKRSERILALSLALIRDTWVYTSWSWMFSGPVGAYINEIIEGLEEAGARKPAKVLHELVESFPDGGPSPKNATRKRQINSLPESVWRLAGSFNEATRPRAGAPIDGPIIEKLHAWYVSQ